MSPIPALQLGRGDSTKMRATVTVPQGIIIGILASHKQPEPRELVNSLRSVEIKHTRLTETEYYELAQCMIEKGFSRDAEKFILELQASLAAYPPGNSETRSTIEQYLQAAIALIRESLKRKCHHGFNTLEAIIAARSLISGMDGTTNQALRESVGVMDVGLVNAYAVQMPEIRIRALNAIAEGIITKLGAWMIWKMVRKYFLGKEPEEVEAEVERQNRIGIIQAQLEIIDMIPPALFTAAGDHLVSEARKLVKELRKLDPDNAASWLKSHIESPCWRGSTT